MFWLGFKPFLAEFTQNNGFAVKNKNYAEKGDQDMRKNLIPRMNGGWMRVAATHSGNVHADDALASVILRLLYPQLHVVRTNNKQLWEDADLRFDIGRRYNLDKLSFDHHQPGGAGVRENGVPFAASGLIWRHYGQELISKLYPGLGYKQVAKVHALVDESLIQGVDAYDNGVRFQSEASGLAPCTLNDMVRAMLPAWCEKQENFNDVFRRAGDFCQTVLINEIRVDVAIVRAEKLTLAAYKRAGKKFLVFDRQLHWSIWQRNVLDIGLKDVLFAIVPNSSGWSVIAQPAVANTFNYRKLLPESWAGLAGKKFSEATGISGVHHCHNGRWIAGANTLESALQLARLAIEA